MILDILGNKNIETVDLLDPLLDRYIKHNLSVKSILRENTVAYNMPLEKLSVKEIISNVMKDKESEASERTILSNKSTEDFQKNFIGRNYKDADE